MMNNGIPAALAVIAMWLLSTAVYYRKRVLHCLGQLWWSFVLTIDAVTHDREDDICPDWADPAKWEASRL